MQDMTTAVCNTVQTPTASATTSVTKANYQTYGKSTSYVPETTLINSRDSKSYTIRKLADGHCWMVEDYGTSPNMTYSGNYWYNRSRSNSVQPGAFTLPTSENLITLKNTYSASQTVGFPLQFRRTGGYSSNLSGTSWTTTSAAYYHRLGSSNNGPYACYTINGAATNTIGHETNGCGGTDSYLFSVRYMV